MKKAAEIISKIMVETAELAGIGVNLLEIEAKGVEIIKKHGAKPFNLGYHPKWAKKAFPAAFCLSVNDTLNHGVPKDYRLQDGDLLTIDTGITYKGNCGDAAITVAVGEPTKQDSKLLKVAKNALYIGIDEIKDGAPIDRVGIAIEEYVTAMNYAVNRSLGGHGIGKEMHQDPRNLPMFDTGAMRNKNIEVPRFKAGQVVCIEPHITYRDRAGFLDSEDEWSVRTRDEENSAVFEHMVLVEKNGYTILTDHIFLDTV